MSNSLKLTTNKLFEFKITGYYISKVKIVSFWPKKLCHLSWDKNI